MALNSLRQFHSWFKATGCLDKIARFLGAESIERLKAKAYIDVLVQRFGRSAGALMLLGSSFSELRTTRPSR